MKRTLLFFFVCAAGTAMAQTKTISQAIITTKTTIVSPEGQEDGAPPAPPAPEGAVVRTFSFGGDGETKSVTTLKGELVKTFTETDMSRTTVIRDNGKKMTTTLMEMMGNKTGFYASDADQEEMRKRMDSLMQTRNQPGMNNSGQQVSGTEISYLDETKKIAGQQCKKALIIATRKNGTKDSTAVWYCPDFKLQGLVSTGGMGNAMGFGFGNRNTGLAGLADLAGFPMQYEMKMNRGRKMIIEVTRIVTDKEIADKEFDIPKDFTLKSAKEMQNGDGRMQIRIGGPGPGGQ
ncbi:MAG: hypothetical protein U0V75_05115 [Ferruginibacter sp.]